MATREDQLVREIEQIRGDLAENLEAIGDRVAPKKVMNRAKAKAADKMEELGEKVSPRRLLERQTEGLRDRLQSIQQSIQESLPSPGSDDRGRQVARTSDRTDVVPAQGRPLGQRPAPTPRSVAAQVESVRADEDGPSTGAIARPVAAGLVIAGAGVLIARLMRPAGPERRAARRVKEKLDPRQDQAVGGQRRVAGELQRPTPPAKAAPARKAPPATKRAPAGATKAVKGQGRGASPVKSTKAAGAAKARPRKPVAP